MEAPKKNVAGIKTAIVIVDVMKLEAVNVVVIAIANVLKLKIVAAIANASRRFVAKM